MFRYCLLVLLAALSVPAQIQPVSSCDINVLNSAEQSARTAMEKREYSVAIQRFGDAVAACPTQNVIRLELANADFMAHRFTEAKDIAEQVLHTEPGNSTALEILGNTQYLRGDVRAAIRTFIDLLDRNPENQEAPYMLGRIYYGESLLDQAIGQFKRLLKIDARSFKAYDSLGLCYEAKNDNELALRYFLTAIKLSEQSKPSYDAAYADLAELFLKSGDPEKAFGAASKAASRNPFSARNFYLGGKALDQLGRTELCLNWLQRSVALDPDYAESEYLLTRVYRRLGQRANAEQAQRKFLAAKAKMRRQSPE